MNPTIILKSIVASLALSAVAHAGGPALLQLPIEGVTPENSDQCEKLLEEKLGHVLSSWSSAARSGDVRMILGESSNLVQFRPGRSQLSLGDIEKALKGSPFSIKRESLLFVGVVQFEISKAENYEEIVSKLSTLDGKKLVGNSQKNKDGSVLITLSDPQHGTAGIMTHQRLKRFLAENKIILNAVSWSGRFHCRAPFGARTAAAEIAGK